MEKVADQDPDPSPIEKLWQYLINKVDRSPANT